MSQRNAVALLSAVAAVCLVARAAAMVVVPADLTELTLAARTIARGRITSLEAQWADGRRRVDTIVTLQVDETLKGEARGEVVIRVPGGRMGRYRSVMPGAPAFRVGEEVVLFLGGAAPALPYVLGLGQGVYRVATDRATGRRVVIPPPLVAGPDGVVPVRRGDPTRRPPAVEQFTAEVRAIVASPEGRAVRQARHPAAGPGAIPSIR